MVALDGQPVADAASEDLVKVALVHQPLGIQPVPAEMGSIEVLNYQLALHLTKCCEVVVYSRRGRDQSPTESRDGVCYRRVSTHFDNRIFAAVKRYPQLKRLPGLRDPKRPLFASSLGHLEYSIKVAADIRKQRCDWVHIHNFSQIVPVVRALNPNVKIAIHMNCEWLTQLYAPIIKRRLRKCDLIIGCSEYITAKIRRAFPELATRCRTVYNGADVDAFAPSAHRGEPKEDAVRLLFVGRIWPDKGPHVLLEAFKNVAERYPQVQIELAGWKVVHPPEFDLLLTDDQKLLDLAPLCRHDYFDRLQGMLPPHLWRRVSIQDAIPHSELAQHYRYADIFVVPSVWNEPFGMVIVEAMSSGLPVIGTRGGGIPEIVEDGETGILVERGDAIGLAEAIARLVEKKDLRLSMGQAGRQRALQLFSWEKASQCLLHHYREFMDPVQHTSPGRFASHSG